MADNLLSTTGKAISEQKKITTQDVLALRERAKTDLFFLAKELLGYTEVTERTHRPLAEFFVQKDPAKTLPEQDRIKDRLLLYPRGCFKSTFNIADCVQWILCFPDVRILILTGAADLGNGFIEELSRHFLIPDSGEKSAFQKLFPEYCIKKKDLLSDRYTCPCRKRHWKEPSIMSASIESSLSGWHFDVVKGDDAVTNRNAETAAGRRKVTRNLHTNRKMLMPYGYWELIGTRYAADDAYGEAIENAKDDGSLKLLERAAMWAKPGYEQKKTADLREEEVELLFPENLTYQFLRKELKRDRRSFFLQYMNDPSEAHDVMFSLDQMRAATVPVHTIPTEGDIYVAWDFAYGNANGRDHTAGAVGLVNDEKLYVVDVIFEKFRPSELGYKVAEVAKRWGAKRISVEDSPGARFLANEIDRWMVELDWHFTINWIRLDTTKDAKANRVRGLEILFTYGKIKFSSGLAMMDEIYAQFTQFGISRRDDIPDAIAYLAKFLPVFVKPDESENDLSAQLAEWRDRNLYNFVYGGRESVPDDTPDDEPCQYRGVLEELVPGLNC